MLCKHHGTSLPWKLGIGKKAAKGSSFRRSGGGKFVHDKSPI